MKTPKPEGGCFPVYDEPYADGMKIVTPARGYICINVHARAVWPGYADLTEKQLKQRQPVTSPHTRQEIE